MCTEEGLRTRTCGVCVLAGPLVSEPTLRRASLAYHGTQKVKVRPGARRRNKIQPPGKTHTFLQADKAESRARDWNDSKGCNNTRSLSSSHTASESSSLCRVRHVWNAGTCPLHRAGTAKGCVQKCHLSPKFVNYSHPLTQRGAPQTLQCEAESLGVDSEALGGARD